jgi:hypothetical protein
MENNAFKYSLVMKGLFGRFRKPQFRLFDLGLTSEDSETARADMVRKGQEMVGTLKAKPGCLFAVQVQPMKVEMTPEGYKVESFVCFTHYRIFEGKA